MTSAGFDVVAGEHPIVPVMLGDAKLAGVMAERLLEEGVYANVINVTGPGPLYSAFQRSTRPTGNGDGPFMSDIVPAGDRSAPVVTVVDGHPHGLAWIGAALATTTIPLGATSYGQSGGREDLYREYGIDATSIMAATDATIGDEKLVPVQLP